MNEITDTYGADPIALFQEWLTEAEDSEINDPTAFCLATADADGRPSARIVLLKQINEHGFKFHTNEESIKGNHIHENPYGALCMHWKSLRRQIRAEGKIIEVSEAESDAYFLTRPRARQTGAWASQQSRNFETRAVLQQAIKESEQRFKDIETIPRPSYWKGFRLVPERIEFWLGNRDRLHTRFEYVLDSGRWQSRWMYP